MPGQNRKARGPNKNDFRSAQNHDQATHNRPRPARSFGPISQDGPRRRSHTQTYIPSGGIHRPNDNSNPNLSSRIRNLKHQSDAVKRELEELISQIDELQPDLAAMDWAGSAGTIVYVPIARTADGSFYHAQMRSTSTGEYPHSVATSVPHFETVPDGPSNGNRPDTPVAFTPYAESIHDRPKSGAAFPSATSSSTVVQGGGSGPGTDLNMSEQGRAAASIIRDGTVPATTAQREGFRCDLPTMSRDLLIPPHLRDTGASNMGRDKYHISGYTAPEMSYRGGGSLGHLNSNANLGGQRTNQARAPATGLLTPPSSPVLGAYVQARYDVLGM